ncbi:ABC transporter permease [Microvirga zambiensis]|uniref:ABC transporter permease n=1 Tax=Microvirga zambiensis TaxID=1402137 RepID=UPI00191FB42B|nr:iron ABC transporter permease [Microvirga zambiensis]
MMRTEADALPTLARESTGVSRYITRSTAIQSAVVAATVILVFAPILPIFYQALIDRPLYDDGQQFTLANLTDLLQSPNFWSVAQNTLVFAAATTIIAQVLGTTFAILIGRTDLPFKSFFAELLIWPLYISSLVLGFGWFMVYGPSGFVTLWVQSQFGEAPWTLYSITGMSIVAGISQMPLAMLYGLGSTALSNPQLEDAARSCGAGPWRTLRSVTLPLLMPSILYSSLLNFTIALEMLSIPLIFGEPARIGFFTTLLYTQGISTPKPNYGLVAAGALILLAIVMLLVFLQNRLLRNSQRYVTVGGKASRPKTLALGRWRLWALAFVSVYVVLFVILPTAVLFLRAGVSFLSPFVPFWTLFTLSHFHDIISFPAYVRSIVNTIIISVVGGFGATFFVAMIALVARRSKFPAADKLEYVAMIPRSIPGLVVGIGFFYALVLLPPLGWLRNTIFVLMVAYTMRYIPTGYGAISPALVQISTDMDRSARTTGADWWTTVRLVILPLIRPALFSSFALMFIHFFKEYSAAVFLFAPGSEVIGTTLLQFWVAGDMGRVAALSTIQIAVTVAFIYGIRKLLGVKIYG